MSTRTEVTRVEMDSINLLEVRITVERTPVYLHSKNPPRPEDVPEDVREALKMWLIGGVV